MYSSLNEELEKIISKLRFDRGITPPKPFLRPFTPSLGINLDELEVIA